MKADELKCLLIDYLLELYPDCLLIGSEIPYLSRKRWVDILLITKERELIAFEIKSDIDTLNRLEGQIRDAEKTFNQVYIVFSTKFKDKKLEFPYSKNVGYIYIDKKEQNIIRKSKNISRLSKYNLCFFLWKSDLNKYFKDKSLSVEKMREIFIKSNTIKDIKNCVIDVLLLRYKKRFQFFKNDRSKKTILADLHNLTTSFDNRL